MRAEKARRSLREFVRQAWPIVDPAHPLIPAWHVDAICDHLQQVARGGINRLIINIPPGHGKSLLVCVLWAAWLWTHRPSWRAIFASHAAPLALRDAVRCRALIESDWYRGAFSAPAGWALSSDQNSKSRFSNTASGDRMSIGAGAGATGFRGDCFVVDDPISAMNSHSKLARDEIARWWDEETSQRLDDPMRAARVVVMQRLDEDDLSGHLIAGGGYEVLCLPSEFEPERRARTFHIITNGNEAREEFWTDPRITAGELLCPALRPAAALELAKRDLGSTGFAGQHQQRPMPAGGGMFRTSWWRFWKRDGTDPIRSRRPAGCDDSPARPLAPLDRTIISLDAAFKATDSSDYVVFQVWGASKADRYLLAQVRARLNFTETLATFRQLARDWPEARLKLVEDKANGSAVIDALKSEIAGIIAINPEGGKEARAAAVQPQIESGNVYLPDGANWLDAFVDEFAAFPRGRHDDQVDAATQALNDLAQRKPTAKVEFFRLDLHRR